jgi:hypothetical protein
MNSLKTWFKKVGNYLLPKQATLGLKIPSLADITPAGLGVNIDGTIVRIVALSGDGYQGEIAINTDFPLIAGVTAGDWYSVTANVTDNAGVLYTNTGQSFVIGDTIYWNGTAWNTYDNFSASTSKFVDYTGTIETFVTTPIALSFVKDDIVRINTITYGNKIYLLVSNDNPANSANYREIYSYGKDAVAIVNNISNFNNILSATDTTVQAALETIDDGAVKKSLTQDKMWIGDASNLPEEIDTVISSLTTDNIAGTALEDDLNWYNNQSTAMSGSAGDRYSGVTYIGVTIITEYTLSSFWLMTLSNPWIDSSSTTGALLVLELEDEGNWTTSEYLSEYGDTGYQYKNSGYIYECTGRDDISGDAIWIRNPKFSGAVIIPDVTYLPVPDASNYLDNDTFVIPIQHKVISIILEELDATGGNFSIGSTDGDDDIVTEFALSGVANTLKDLIYIQLDTMLSTSATKTLYINISTAAEVKLYIITQKW